MALDPVADWVAFQAAQNASYTPANTALQSVAQAAREAASSSGGSSGGMLTSSTGSGTRDIITRESVNIPALDSTTESTTNTRGLIESIYQDELGRALGSKDADKGALDYWTSRLQSGATPAQIRAEIEGTPEGTVFDAYTGLLGRSPDTEGSQYWQQQLTTGALTPEQLRTSFLQSEEAKSRTFEDDPVKQGVSDLFETVMGRAPKPEGLDYWEGQFKTAFSETGDASTALQMITGGLQRSKEFLNNSAQSIYQNIYGQPGNEQDIQTIEEQVQELIDKGTDPLTALTQTQNAINTVKETQDRVTGYIEGAYQGDILQYGQLLKSFRDSGQKLDKSVIEAIGLSRTQDRQTAYNYAVGAQAIAEGLEKAEQLRSEGNVDLALQIEAQLDDPQGFFDYYNENPDLFNGSNADDRLRDETATGAVYGFEKSSGGGFGGFIKDTVLDDWIGLDDSGGILGSTKEFIKNPIEALDRWKDMPSTKIAIAALSFAVLGPVGGAKATGAALSALDAYNTLDSGENLSPMQVVSLVLNAGNIAELGQAAYTAAGYGELGAGFASEQSLMNAAQNFGLNTPDALAGISQVGEKVKQVNDIVTEPAKAVANAVVDNFGGKDFLISRVGSEFADEALQGLASGTTAAMIAEATGENPAKAFLQELKGTDLGIEWGDLIPELPEEATNFIAGLVDQLPTEELAQVEDWVRDQLSPFAGEEDKLREQFAGASNIEDWLKDNVDLSGIEDWVRENASGVEDGIRIVANSLPNINVNTNVNIPGGGVNIPGGGGGFTPKEEEVTYFELSGDAFTPKRGRQGGLAVDTEFLYDDPSLALAILEGRA